MQVKQVFVIGAMALATGAAFAQAASNVPLSRAQVAESVLDARAAGTLTPAGEGMTPGYGGAGPSQTTRAAVDAQVLQARASGDLVPAAINSPSVKFYNQLIAAPSTTTRDHVRDEVSEARFNGTLIPAGQGEFVGPESIVHVARHAAPAHEIVAASTVK
jgi:hypothetical protein